MDIDQVLRIIIIILGIGCIVISMAGGLVRLIHGPPGTPSIAGGVGDTLKVITGALNAATALISELIKAPLYLFFAVVGIFLILFATFAPAPIFGLGSQAVEAASLLHLRLALGV